MASNPRIDLAAPDAVQKLDQHYRTIIAEAVAARADEDIHNADPYHAAYIITEILENAKTTVRIYTTKLARTVKSVEVYANEALIQAARSFLTKPDSRLSILSRQPIDPESHPLLAQLAADDAGRHGHFTVGVWQGPADEKIPDFTVMDDSGYRLEVDNNSASAVVNFGNRHLATALADYFDAMIADDHCETILVANA